MFNFLRKLSKKESQSLEDCLAQNGLPFDNIQSAEEYYFPLRDKDLAELVELNSKYPELDLNFKATSLLRAEEFYFKVFKDKTIRLDISKERMEELLTQYVRQVYVANEMAEWKVFENDFAQGRYEIGLLLADGTQSQQYYARDLDKTQKSSERNYLFYWFMLHVPPYREQEVL